MASGKTAGGLRRIFLKMKKNLHNKADEKLRSSHKENSEKVQKSAICGV
jgi:hypothetical protein